MRQSTSPAPQPAQSGQHPAPRRENSLRGIGLVLLGGAFLSSADAVSKLMAETVPALQITWLRYAAFALIMLAVTLPGGMAALKPRRPKLQLARGIAVTVSSILFVSSLRYLPIADATATSFISPLFVTALSIPLLGERIGWRRWTATIVGLIGVLIVVRPGGAGFQLAALLPMLSASSWAFALIFTRMMSATENPVTTLAWSAIIGFLLLSLLQPFGWQPLTAQAIWLGVFVGVASTIGHWFVILAFRHADASLLAPFAYLQLLWASIFGYFMFAALPDRFTWLGAVIISASGLYIAHRERLRARGPLIRD
ncbi:multidrug DMT transporter permease [Bosea sp. WAO]|uniref:DMT family transporter n=1 Tax=Bosea sp. WAO TaxID=406341 RepID=UPI00074A09E6|nr:DMT family transporter [Bosea sp. WAO]KUL93591.1 multidrug DMT transporter permease [Bosea sp. WAO]